MVNDTIVNARNFSDRLCNEVILWSNDFARDLGVSYGELWAGITIFVVFMVVFYNVMLLLSWYCPKLKKTIKYTYWTTHGLIVLFLLFIFPTIFIELEKFVICTDTCYYFYHINIVSVI